MVDRLYGVDLGGRSVPLLLPEDYAQERGLPLYNAAPMSPEPSRAPPLPLGSMPPRPLSLPPGVDQRLAFGSNMGTGGPPNVPDVAPNMGAGGAPGFVPSVGGAGGAMGANMGGAMGAPASEAQAQRASVATEKEPPKPAKGREPLKTTEIEVPDEYLSASPRRSASRVMKVKGGDVRASFQRKPGKSLPEGYEEEQRLSEIKSDRALIGGALDEAEENQQMRDATERRLLQQRADLLGERANRVRQDEEINKRRAEVLTRERETQAIANEPGGAEGYWQDKGIAARILGGIGVAFSEYARILSGNGGENIALRMQENSINHWVQEQRARYERAKERNEEVRNHYREAIEHWGTPEAAEQELRLRGNLIADALLENQARRSGDRQLFSSVQAELARRQEQRNRERLALQDRVSADVVENWQNVPDRYVQFGGAQKPKAIDRMVRLPNGEYAWARDSTTARGVQSKIVANQRIADIAHELQTLTDSAGKRGWTADTRGRAAALNKELMFTYKDAAQAGALDKGLQDALGEMTGNPEELFRNPNTGAKLGEVGRQARSKVAEEVRYNLHADPDAMDPVMSTRPESARSDE